MMISDEDLAKIAWTETRTDFIRAIRAMRAGLMEPVTPLAPGETVMIPDAVYPGDAEHIWRDGDYLAFGPAETNNEVWMYLDAAGVQALIDVARRWQAAQEGATT